MISIPSAHKAAIRERPTVLNKRLVFSLVGGDTLTVNNANIWQGSLVIEDTVCSTGAFEIGSTHVNQMTVSLYGASQSAISNAVFSINSEGHLMLNGETVSYEDVYRNINFNDAKVEVYLASPGYDYFLKGTYTVVSATHNDNIIEITAYDYMDKFSRPYSLSTRTYPCTLKQIVAEACTFCGVTDNTGNFAHYNQQISAKPDADTLTFREVIGYVAQIAGYNARMSADGKLQFKQFNLGGFGTSGAYHTVDEIYSCRIDSDIINITGIHVDEENAVTETDSEGIKTTSLVTTGYDAGTEGYVLSISGNPLIKNGLGQNVATWLFSTYGNKPFRIGNVTHSSDPTIEASDIMKVTDRHGTYNMLVSETKFCGSEAQSTSSNATSPRSTEAVQYSNIDKIKTVASEAHLVAMAAQGYANEAQRSANAAQASADSAATAAQTAWNHADDANTAAQTAWNRAGDALTAAGNAQSSADAAATAASNAQTSASNAQTSADNAQTQANLATGYADDALIQLSEIEQVANILNWISQHGSYAKTTDTAVVKDKNYYTKSGNVYTLVTEPDVADIGSYYELHIDEAISNYVSTHLALTNDGLYVIKGANDYRVRITNNAFQVLDANGNQIATYGTSIYFDSTKEYTIGNATNYFKFFDSDDDGIADSIAIIAEQIVLGNQDVGEAIDEANINLANTKAALDDDIYGDVFWQYTTGGVTYDVWLDESTNQYTYVDGNGDEVAVAYENLDVDATTGDKVTVRKGGMLDNIETINGSILIDNNEPSVTIQAVKKTNTGTQTGDSKLKLMSERISFEKNGTEVMYMDSTEDDGVIDINSARVHNSLKIGHLELFEHNGGIGIRRWN